MKEGVVLKEVRFVHISAEAADYGLFKGMEYQFAGVEEAIQAQIEEGWEYCGYAPVTTRGVNSGTQEISLVFQRDKIE